MSFMHYSWQQLFMHIYGSQNEMLLYFYSARSIRSQEINNIHKVGPQAFNVAVKIRMQIN